MHGAQMSAEIRGKSTKVRRIYFFLSKEGELPDDGEEVRDDEEGEDA